MRRKLLLIAIALIAGMVAAWLAASLQPRKPPEPPPSPTTGITTGEGRYLFSVTLHTPEEIGGLLTRAEELARNRRVNGKDAGIALVLHGPEIELFAKKNYPRFQKMVDQAARLDAGGVIELKMCRTEMKNRGIREEDIPAFIELVPYGPDEEMRLRRNGYVYF